VSLLGSVRLIPLYVADSAVSALSNDRNVLHNAGGNQDRSCRHRKVACVLQFALHRH
jgi:hypothetical protein